MNIEQSIYKEYWTYLNSNDKVTSEEIAEWYYNFMKKTEFVKQFCNINKIKYREDLGQYYIYVKRKQYSANSKHILIERLYTVFAKDALTLEKAYIEWMLWRREIGTAPKTLQENANEWKNYIKHSKLASTILLDIDTLAIEDFLYSVTKDFAIDNKRFTNIISVLNGIFRRCVSMQSITRNPLSDMDLSIFRKRCKPKNTNKDNYSLAERSAILEYLAPKTDIYSLAISLSMYLCVRIGELLAIRPENISDGILHLNRSMRTIQYMNDDLTFSKKYITNEERIKGNKDSGFREIPLTEKALSIINRTIALYPNYEFLFMHNGRQSGDAFNRELRKVCEALGIRYRSSHQIRFTVATLLYENGLTITQLSYMLGHSDTNTTWHYIRQSKPDSKTLQTMCSILD